MIGPDRPPASAYHPAINSLASEIARNPALVSGNSPAWLQGIP